jgi:UDP-N-acetylglucosamine:LPS N-acetylglucosamine transferase
MPANFAFYIHHHGSGHVMRAIAIASRLKDATISFLGSDLGRYHSIIPDHIHCIDLPRDVAGAEDVFAKLVDLDFLHYAPLNIKGIAERSARITAELHALFPVMLIVDVSVEVALLAALSSIPTVVIRQNGDRNDIPHLNAYQSAQLLIAPCPSMVMNQSDAQWVEQKTFYSGGFSRYTGLVQTKQQLTNNAVGVLTGQGGTSIDYRFIALLALRCPKKIFHVVGELAGWPSQSSAENVTLYGALPDPSQVLENCEVVIGNAGHNTVMEMADLNKKFICIFEERPFDEQLHKARLLEQHQMAVVVAASKIQESDWNELICTAQRLPASCWQGVINADALESISEILYQKWEALFTVH